jgi:hypothetical protein
VRPRDVGALADAEEAAPGGVAAQLGQAVIEPDVAAQHAEHDHAPQPFQGVVVAAVAARLPEGVEQGLVGPGGEHGAEGLQGGGAFQLRPGEQRLGGVKAQGKTAWEGQGVGHRNVYPRRADPGRKIQKNRYSGPDPALFPAECGGRPLSDAT